MVVPDFQLSLAIGKEGQNVRLAAKLCGWKIDIKSHTQFEEAGGTYESLMAASAPSEDEIPDVDEDGGEIVYADEDEPEYAVDEELTQPEKREADAGEMPEDEDGIVFTAEQ